VHRANRLNGVGAFADDLNIGWVSSKIRRFSRASGSSSTINTFNMRFPPAAVVA
jgi:hypothetical protein